MHFFAHPDDCPQCEEALSNFESASAIFKDSSPPVKFAKMDATVAEHVPLYEKAIERMHRPRLPMLRCWKDGVALPFGGSAFGLDYTVDFLEKVQKTADVNVLLGPSGKKDRVKIVEPEGSFVADLTPDTFNDTISGALTAVVTFIQPECGGCKDFAPVFSAASVRLREEDPTITLAKVDLTEKGNKQLCRQSRCTSGESFPIIKVFHGLDEIQSYAGPRDEAGFVNFVKALSKMHAMKKEKAEAEAEASDDDDERGESDGAGGGGGEDEAAHDGGEL